MKSYWLVNLPTCRHLLKIYDVKVLTANRLGPSILSALSWIIFTSLIMAYLNSSDVFGDIKCLVGLLVSKLYQELAI